MSLQDPLTGLNNRFGLTRAFNELKAGAKHNDLLFVIAIDIDFFKRFNDQHGHLVGDECLVHLANNIRTVFVITIVPSVGLAVMNSLFYIKPPSLKKLNGKWK